MLNIEFSGFDEMAKRFQKLSETDFHTHPEVRKRLASAGVVHLSDDEYTLEGHDMDKDLTDEEISLLRHKFDKVLEKFTQDVIDGKTKP